MSPTARMDPDGGPDGVTVTGSASVDVEPDVVVAELGAEVREPDVSAALRTAEAALEAMRQALLTDGVGAPDLRSGQTSIWREDRTDERGEVVAVVVHVTLGLRVTLRDVPRAGETVHAALAAAGSAARMTSLGFAVSDASDALLAAREAAFADARATAERYALLAGRALGPVQAVTEGGDGGPPVLRAFAARAGDVVAAGGAVPVDPGRQSVPASVTVRWAWAD